MLLALCMLLACISCGKAASSEELTAYVQQKNEKAAREYFEKNIPDATDISFDPYFVDYRVTDVITGVYYILDDSYSYVFDVEHNIFYTEQMYEKVIEKIKELFLATHDFGDTDIDISLPEIRVDVSVLEYDEKFDESKAADITREQTSIPVTCMLDGSMTEKDIDSYAENTYKNNNVKINFHPEDLEKFVQEYRISDLSLARELPNIHFWFINNVDGFADDVTVWYKQYAEDGKVVLERRYSKNANFVTEIIAEEKI